MKNVILILFFLLFSFIPSFAVPTNSEAIKAYNDGIEYYGQDEIEKSIESFKRAVTIQSDFYEAYYNLGQVYLSVNNVDEAIKNYELAVKYEPEDYESCYVLGELFYKKGYLSKSIGYFSKIPPTSDLYSNAQLFREKVIKRQKEVLLNQAQMKAEADKLIIKDMANVTDITGIASPSGVAGDSLGNIYVASYGENKVYKIAPNGQRSVFVTEQVLSGPISVAVDKNDNVYVANYVQGNILKVSPDGAPFVYTKVLKPYCVNVIKDYLYVTEQETNKVMRFKL
ncbi:MAG: tetratricopeptide repeat protein [Cyanobacteria bacterium SIG30]|nr:tetratricopeptide repeat protein [Cyanobacteria bacterium SIG30]